METEERLERLDKILAKLRDEWIFVEGKKDREALRGLGFLKILTISGNLRLSCDHAASQKALKVFVLSDLDRRGDELAKNARDELESRSIRADIDARRVLAYLLNIRHFEDAKRGYDKIKDKVQEKG